MPRLSKAKLSVPVFALVMVAACAQTGSVSHLPERGDGGAPSMTVDESLRQWRARRSGDSPAVSPDTIRPIRTGTLGRSGTAGGSSPYVGNAPGLPSIPMRPDATTIPLPGRTTFPLPGGTTIPTPMDPLSPNPATTTVPRPN